MLLRRVTLADVAVSVAALAVAGTAAQARTIRSSEFRLPSAKLDTLRDRFVDRIRPGAWLLTVTNNEIGWCSMAHVYGAPGSYQISTAGHCGKAGDIATMIGAVGNHQVAGATVPVLLDFGAYSRSTGDAGIGKDW